MITADAPFSSIPVIATAEKIEQKAKTAAKVIVPGRKEPESLLSGVIIRRREKEEKSQAKE